VVKGRPIYATSRVVNGLRYVTCGQGPIYATSRLVKGLRYVTCGKGPIYATSHVVKGLYNYYATSRVVKGLYNYYATSRVVKGLYRLCYVLCGQGPIYATSRVVKGLYKVTCGQEPIKEPIRLVTSGCRAVSARLRHLPPGLLQQHSVPPTCLTYPSLADCFKLSSTTGYWFEPL